MLANADGAFEAMIDEDARRRSDGFWRAFQHEQRRARVLHGFRQRADLVSQALFYDEAHRDVFGGQSGKLRERKNGSPVTSGSLAYRKSRWVSGISTMSTPSIVCKQNETSRERSGVEVSPQLAFVHR